MAIPASCPSCHASGQVPDEALGHQLTCPVCGTAFLLGKPAAPVEMPEGLGVWVDSAPAAARPAATPAPEGVEAVVPTVAAVPNAEPAPPPSPEAAATAVWIQAETERFEAFVAGGLARLEQARRANADAESQHEAACVTRAVELSRQSAVLDGRRQDLDRREIDLRRTADALAARDEEAGRRAAELAEREAAVVAREGRRAKLESEAAELARLVAELRPAVERLELRKTEAEAVRAELAAKQTALDRRLIEVGRSELALQKRMTEVDEMEQTLREELEEREADLERQRVTLMEEVRARRDRVSVGHPTPPPRTALQLPLPPSLPPRLVVPQPAE